MMIKMFTKKLFGVKYEKLVRNLIICAVLFGGLYYSGFHLAVAPFIICFMTMALTVGEMCHALSSDDNAANMKQLFMLPIENKGFIFTYIMCLGGYVFLTRTLLLWAVIFAVSGVDVRIAALAILSVVNATLLSAGIFVWKKWRIPACVWLVGIIAAFKFLMDTVYIWPVLGLSLVMAIVFLAVTDPYAFYREEGGKKSIIKGGNRHSVWAYFFRYIASHNNYIVNGLIIWGLAAVFPFTFKQFADTNPEMYLLIIPIGFALLTLNTPICILLSCDPELDKAVRFLPGQIGAFFVPYAMFIFVCNLLAEIIYLVSLKLTLGVASIPLIIMAVCFALISAVLSVMMEYFFPIRGWKIENELWNHPRKYVVPGIMVVLAGLTDVVFKACIIIR